MGQKNVPDCKINPLYNLDFFPRSTSLMNHPTYKLSLWSYQRRDGQSSAQIEDPVCPTSPISIDPGRPSSRHPHVHNLIEHRPTITQHNKGTYHSLDLQDYTNSKVETIN